LPFVFYKCDISLHKIKCKTKKVWKQEIVNS
jgi:hypothetical protein